MLNNIQQRAGEKPSAKEQSSSSNQNATKGVTNEYYEEYCKVFMANAVLNAQYKEIKHERDALAEKLEQLERKFGVSGTEGLEYRREKSNYESKSDRKLQKRERRTAIEIARDHICPIETCGKAYGSDTALNLHIRTKHPNYKQ